MFRPSISSAVSGLALLLTAAAVSLTAQSAAAEPAVIYSTGGKFDKSFNEAAFNGAERFKAEFGGDYGEFQIDGPAQSEQALRNFARRGYSPIVAIGFVHASALEKVAPDFPDTRFAIVDMVVDAPNVRSVVYREQEGSYVVGWLAANMSETGKLGFVGGMDIPLIRKFACGYAQGALAADNDVEVFVNMTGVTPAAWSDPARGAELAKSQIDRGADVILQAAGGTGIGVLQAAADASVFGIGTDSNQNGLHPGSVLTSMLKRTDVAVYEAFRSAAEERWKSGVHTLGLKEGGLGWALDDNNRPFIPKDLIEKTDAVASAIAEGLVTVHDSSRDGACPALE